MLYKYGAILLLLCTSLPAAAEVAVARVVEVRRGGTSAVVLQAGRAEGLERGSTITLLREGEPIVHPLTGDTLGVPQEPVGVAEVREVEAHRAVAVLVKIYSTPQVGDMGEYEEVRAAEAAGEEAPIVAQVIERVRDLEEDIQQYQQSQKTLSAYPVFARQVWDEMNSIKSYLVSLDERLIQLEAQQGEDRQRLAQVVGGEYPERGDRELTIRYDEDTDIRLQVAGRTLLISIERDSLRLEEEVGAPPLAAAAGDTGAAEPAEEEEGWGIDLDGDMLDSPYIFGGGLALIALLTAVALMVVKRRYDDVMDGLDEFDEDEDFEEEEEQAGR